MRHAVSPSNTDASYPWNPEPSSRDVIRSDRDFWIFHTAFWSLAAAALFVYGLTYGHVRVALIRNIYNPLVGFACSYLIKTVYESRLPARAGARLAVIAGLSLVGGLVSALIVNPITFSLLGYDLADLPLSSLLKDGLYYVLLYLVWSLLYLQLSGQSLAAVPSPETPSAATEAISVTKGNQVFRLDPANICCIRASGDYVEICTAGERYLKHGTIGSYERMLGVGTFVRIHRSIIVNRDKVVSVAGPAKGQFWITLEDGQEVRSSRRYREAVESLTPEAP